MHSHTLLQLLLPALSLLSASAARSSDDKILLSSVATLTFRKDALTSHRRVAAVPQLTCEGPACAYHAVTSLRCTNAGAGYDAEDIQWTCTAELPAAFKLGATDVQCEGYASSRDKHVLRGSCGATYRLLFTEQGEAEFAEQLARDRTSSSSWFGSSKNKPYEPYGQSKSDEGIFGGRLFLVLFVAVAAWIVWNAYIRGPGRRRGGRVTGPRRPGGGGGGGGGGGPGGWGGGNGGGGGFGGWNTGSDPSDEPPPPYSPSPGVRYTKTAPSAGSSRGAGSGWGAGLGNRSFWGGALGGAAAGYMAGSRRSGQQETRRRGAGWGGGSGDAAGSGSGWGSSAAGSSSGGRASEGRTYESTGFGGTSRR